MGQKRNRGLFGVAYGRIIDFKGLESNQVWLRLFLRVRVLPREETCFLSGYSCLEGWSHV